MDELEYDNLKEYFTELRAKYDPELFSSVEKVKLHLKLRLQKEMKVK